MFTKMLEWKLKLCLQLFPVRIKDIDGTIKKIIENEWLIQQKNLFEKKWKTSYMILSVVQRTGFIGGNHKKKKHKTLCRKVF